ncbi:hypothetical protein QBC41DRAFT_281911 [Cercophora samala]|uniref:Uncharacterized protein n=1 Tax=Cercophora samala TaxID=330535 RepID=A0AA39Z829_9PEZI|nr:hypothetical protein QBC41DRAFT_281911 [Cercophora samala]
MSTVTRTWQEQERLRLEKEKENERIRQEQEQQRARIEREKEAERKRVESERAQKESLRVASLRAAASKTSTIARITSTRTTHTTSSTALQPPPLSTENILTPRPTTEHPPVTTSIRLSVRPINPDRSSSSTSGTVGACGQSGYFNCASEHGGGCCPVGFACSKGDICVSPQLEKEKPPESLPCPGYKGYLACKEDIGGGCCPANYACIKDSRAQCRLSDANLVLTNIDRLATRIPIPTSSVSSEITSATGGPAPTSRSEIQQPSVGTPGDAAGIIVGGIMAIVAYFLGSYLLFIYKQRRGGSPFHKSFRVLEVRSQWRDARAKARSELPSHHGMSELAASNSRSGSPLPPVPSLSAGLQPLTVSVEVTRERQVDIMNPLPPPPLKLRSSLLASSPVPVVPVSPPSTTQPTLTPTLISPVSAKTTITAKQLPPISPPPNIPLPPTPITGGVNGLGVLEQSKMSGALEIVNGGAQQETESVHTREISLDACLDEQQEEQDGSSARADSSTIIWM